MIEPQSAEEMRSRAIEIGRRLGTVTGPRLRCEPKPDRRAAVHVATVLSVHVDDATMARLAAHADWRGTDARGLAEAIIVEAVKRGMIASILGGLEPS